MRAALFLLLLGAAAFAADEARLDKAKELFEQAKPLAAQAEDPDAEDKDRKAARSDALKLLKQARDEFQAWQSANGEDADDPIGREIGKLLYWLKKMSGISDPRFTPPPRDPPKDPPKDPPGDSPAPSGDTGKPPAPPEPPAAPTPEQIARDDFARLQELEKTLRSDPAALKELYEQFLADHPDPALPEYTKAATRVGELQEELNATFKTVVQADPDSVAGIDTSATPAVMARLKRELASGDAEARKNAARLLGLTRSGAASYALMSALTDGDDELSRIAAESLVAIGGRRTAENLVRTYRDRNHDSQTLALGVLEQIAKKGPVDAAAMSSWIGRFGLSNDGEVSGRACAFLESLGEHGGPGLVEVLDQTRNDEKKLWVMKAIARINYYRGADKLADFLLRGDGRIVGLRANAIEAIKKMGVPTTPYLINALRNGRTKDWAALVLREVTGQMYGSGDIRQWTEWWQTVGKHKSK